MRLSAFFMPTRTNGKVHRIVRQILVVPNKNCIKQRRWQHSKSASPSPPPPPVVLERSKSFAIGAIAGTCGSLAGMGGGFVMVPLMTSKRLFQVGLTQHQAHATSLFAVATTGLAGAMSYSGEVDYEVAAFVALSGMATASLGAHASARLSEKVLRKVLGVFMLAVAPTILAKDYILTTEPDADETNLVQFGDKDDDSDGDSSSSEVALRRIKASGIGCFSGFLAGMFGVGGGAVVVPALSLIMDMNHYQALGTSLCAMVPTAVVGTATHMSKGTVVMRVAPALALGAFTGGLLGGKLGLSIPEQELKYGFSGTMVVLGLRTIFKA